MADNTVKAYDGSEVYTSKILELADDFVDHEVDEKRREDIYNNSSIFMSMILYISDNIPKPDNNDMRNLKRRLLCWNKEHLKSKLLRSQKQIITMMDMHRHYQICFMRQKAVLKKARKPDER